MTKAKTTNSTPAPEKRDDTADTPVTELAHVDAKTSDKTLEQMAGVSKEPYKPAEKDPEEASQQQKDALEGLKEARDEAKGKEPKKGDEPHGHHIPHHLRTGPGSFGV